MDAPIQYSVSVSAQIRTKMRYWVLSTGKANFRSDSQSYVRRGKLIRIGGIVISLEVLQWPSGNWIDYRTVELYGLQSDFTLGVFFGPNWCLNSR